MLYYVSDRKCKRFHDVIIFMFNKLYNDCNICRKICILNAQNKNEL